MTTAVLARTERRSASGSLRGSRAASTSPGSRSFAVSALVALVPTVVLATLMVLVASLIGPFIMFALPFMLLFGFAIGPLVALVRGDLR